MYDIDNLPPSSTVDALREHYPKFLVGFFAPWCPHCRTFLPKFDMAQSIVEQKLGREIPVFALSAEGYSNARQVPYFELFEEGEMTPVPDAREPRALVDYMLHVSES